MKRLLILLIVVALTYSCRKDDSPDVFDFNVSGVEQIEARVDETITIKLIVSCNNVAVEDVSLALEDVPAGITYTFDKTAGTPEFEATLEIKITRAVSGGFHTLRLIGTSPTVTKEVPIVINVDKSLSATFTVYNAVLSSDNESVSNLLDSALIKIYKDEATFASGIPDYMQYTKNSGKAYFYRLPAGNYLFTIEKGTASNIVQKRSVNGVMKGFVVAGVFRTQMEIVNSAQPKAKPGDLKFRDLNADNKIDDADLGQFDNLSIYTEQTNEKVIWIGQ